MSRKTGLHMTAYSLGGTSYLGDFENAEFSVDPTMVDGRGAAERYGKMCTVVRRGSIDTGLMRTSGACRVSALAVSALTVGGVDVKPEWQSLRIGYQNTLLESEGGSDEWGYYQAESTDFSGEITLLVDSAGWDAMAVALGTLSGLNVTLALTIGGGTISIPVVLGRVTHSVRKGENQQFTCAFSKGGIPTAPTGLTLFALGLTGSAALAFQAVTGARTYAGDALIERGDLSVQKGGLEKQTYTLRIQGKPGDGS